MADKPMLFSTPMVRALLDGRKTQTRRIIKPEPDGSKVREGSHLRIIGDGFVRQVENHFRPRWLRGDRLYVRETFSGPWAWRDVPPREWDEFVPIHYWADGNPADGDWTKPKPGIHMPRCYSRLTLAVTDMRVERLQDISEGDSLAEGVQVVGGICVIPVADGAAVGGDTPRDCYEQLWEHINGEGSWQANPFVVAITFDVHKTNIDQIEAA